MFFEKIMWKIPKIGDTPLIYIKEKIVPDFGEKTHNTIRVYKSDFEKISLFFIYQIFLNKRCYENSNI